MSKRKLDDMEGMGSAASRTRSGRSVGGAGAALRDRTSNNVGAPLTSSASSSAPAQSSSGSAVVARRSSRKADVSGGGAQPVGASASAAPAAACSSSVGNPLLDASMMNASSATVEGDAHMVAEGAPSPLLLGDLSLVSPSPAAQVVRHASAPYDWDEAYQAQILAHQRKLELAGVTRRYLNEQPSINARMRAILADWLVEVCSKYKQQPETFFRTLLLIDQYLSVAVVQRQKLQLVGVTALLIASKYEEVCGRDVTVAHMVHICAGTYTSREVTDMERSVLAALRYSVSQPTPYTFMPRFLSATSAAAAGGAAPGGQASSAAAAGGAALGGQAPRGGRAPSPPAAAAPAGEAPPAPEPPSAAAPALSAAEAAAQTSFLATYLLELAAADYDCLLFLPSQLAAAACALAARSLAPAAERQEEGAPAIAAAAAAAAACGWAPAALAEAARFCEVVAARATRAGECTQADALQAVRRKYEAARYGAVALLPLSNISEALQAAGDAEVAAAGRCLEPELAAGGAGAR